MLNPSVQVHVIDGILVAEFWDCLRLDPMPIQTLRQRFEEWLQSGGPPHVVIDLNGVAFAGSMALGGFLKLHRIAKSQRGGLVFCNVDPQVLEVFRVAKVNHLFRFVADVPSALDFIKTGPPLAESENGSGSAADDAPSAPQTPPAPLANREPPKLGPLSSRRKRS